MDWKRAGHRIALERARSWPRAEDFAAKTGLSRRTVLSIENGEQPRYATATLAAIEAALGWDAGSCERIAAGGEPTYSLDDADLRRIHDAWPFLSAADRRRVASIAEELRRD